MATGIVATGKDEEAPIFRAVNSDLVVGLFNVPSELAAELERYR